MKRQLGSLFRKTGIVLGSACIIGAVLLMMIWILSGIRNERKSAEYVQLIRGIIAQPQSAMLEPQTDNAMPALSVDHTDFIALLEFPANGCDLPVGNRWEDAGRFPCRFYGSAYDRSLIIGTSNRRGQIDFVKNVNIHDAVYLTDMLGNRYGYTVCDIVYRDNADFETLSSESDSLTIFVKNEYSFEYIIIRCE